MCASSERELNRGCSASCGAGPAPAAFRSKAPQPGDGGGEAARAQYSIPGILHFLQHEWARFEVERAQWEVERAELQVASRAERRCTEFTLIESVLRLIRCCKHYIFILVIINCQPAVPLLDSRGSRESVTVEVTSLADLVSCLRLRYLQEVGYTDTILDVKSQRVRALLGLAGDAGDKPSDKKTEPMVNGTEPSSLKDTAAAPSFHLHVLFFISPSKHRCSPAFIALPVPSSSSLVSLPPPAGPNRSKLQDMLANLRDAEDLPSMPPAVTPPSRSSVPRLNEHEVGQLNETVSLPQIANNKDALRKTWNPKFTLRSHFDSVRSLAFHPVEPVLVTASEDHTLKLWNLQKTAPAKKCAALDVEPIYTFRAHSGAVLCVTMSSSGEQCFSGGVDGTIQSWNTPNPNIDPYDSYEPSVLRGALCGHTDAVWGLVYSSAHRRLLSCSADGTVRLWSVSSSTPWSPTWTLSPASPWIQTAFTSCQEVSIRAHATSHNIIRLYKEPTGTSCIYYFHSKSSGVKRAVLTAEPITASGNQEVFVYDETYPVSLLCADWLSLLPSGHDCSIRLWNMESKTCIQEFTAHRKKFEESIHDVAFHPTKCYIGSAGADALAKVFV
uniref:Striatin, calmodulin binding protein n=1 Tax=Neolamprologus brichardi TaxID=32507 RepID=A0A3Q4HVB0_NEOBR